MNYSESQIENFKSCNAGIPESLAVSALVERFFEGWDASDIEGLDDDFDPTSTEDWKDLAESPAWDYASAGAISSGILVFIAARKESMISEKIDELEDELQTLDSCEEGDIPRINEIKQEIAQLCVDLEVVKGN